LSAGPLVWQAALLQAAGGGANRWLPDGFPGWQTALPPLAIVSQLGGWLDTWPDWLKAQLSPFLPFLQPPTPPAPAPEPARPTRLGELLDEPVAQEPTKEVGVQKGVGTAVPPPTATPPTQTAPAANGYPVPLKSQGSLGGSAACAPTSVSMILDYYHNLDGQNQTATPQELLTMLDKGDFTQGKGMSLSRITDELQDLGYANISAQVNASQTDLQNHLQQGPVITTVRLDMQTNQLMATGSVVHAVVVKGISGDGQTVFINDPWTGSEVLLPLADFAATWQGGSNGLYVIRP
jgi:predicted double-glycine peptidase